MKHIKKIIKKLLRKTDWRIKKIYRNKSYTNIHPKLELLNAMHDCSGIIHMGAHRGTEAAVYDWFNKQTIWIEANPKIIDDLNDHISQYVNQRVIQALLGDEDNKLENFNISSNDGASSSIFSFGSYKKTHEEIKMTSVMKLKTSTLDSIIKKDQLDADILGVEGTNTWLGDGFITRLFGNADQFSVPLAWPIWSQYFNDCYFAGFSVWEYSRPHIKPLIFFRI
jgi:FkbM family methyltransferase